MSGIVGSNLGRGSGLVKAGSVGADSVTGASIADDAIDSEHYVNASIDNAHLADDAVGLAEMASGTDGNIISYDASGDPVAISTGNDGQVLTSTGAGSPPAFEAAAGGITQANFIPNANPIIINGDMAVSQRSTSVTGITSGGYYTVDRYKVNLSSCGTWTQTQEALTADEAYEDGFSKAFKMDNTTADASLSADDVLVVEQRIEAQNCQLFKFGNSNAEKLTLGFWVKATKTGTHIIELYQEDDDRICCQAYTVSSTNTWEYKVLNFPADTTGVIDNNNGVGIQVNFYVAAGTTYTSGTLATTWAARVNGNRAVGQVNGADSNSNNFHITGVQLEVGEYTSATLPPFQHETFDTNLRRCWRYFWALCPADALSANSRLGVCATLSTTRIEATHIFPIRMRTKPTLVSSGTASDFYLYDLITNSETTTAIGLTASGSAVAQGVYHECASGLTAGGATQVLTGNTDARLSFDAEI